MKKKPDNFLNEAIAEATKAMSEWKKDNKKTEPLRKQEVQNVQR